ncbi:hypothetical protein BGW37DRAFT_471034 [Umbelopsis sp. PMI_123]|nr:hypothetical protein BGW37DRAFT_471034 [Umbelopsis sp. PMI_123]
MKVQLLQKALPMNLEKLYETYSKCPAAFRLYPDGPASILEEFVDLYEMFQKDKNRHTFVAYDKNSNPERAIGSVQEMKIGSIWIIPEMRGTYALIEMSYISTIPCFRNSQILSHKVATKLGFTYEATFKHHIIMHDGTTRHSVFYSVVIDDWLSVKEKLEGRLLAFK